MKKALICGISGQDGAYLTQLLLQKGYKVVGTSRDAKVTGFEKLKFLRVFDDTELLSMIPTDFNSVLKTIAQVQPDEIYYLAGQSSVGFSFQQPIETIESNALGILNILEATRFLKFPVHIYNSGSGESYGDTGDVAADENTPFKPKSPYAIAKATSVWEVSNYRNSYNIWACSGILFNHESPLRPERFVTKKIISKAVKISRGERTKLNLGNIDIHRDWGYAPEYVEAMWMMLQQQQPQDFVIATGETNSLRNFLQYVFEILGLNWQEHVLIDDNLIRPSEIIFNQANTQKAKSILGWSNKTDFKKLIEILIEYEISNLS